jgi:hypothetical protein
MAEIIRLTQGKITVLAGVDPTCLGGLCLGADGVMSSAADIVPGDVVRMYNLFREGKLKEAAELQLLLLGIFKALCTVRDRDSLVVLREGNKMLGQIMGGSVTLNRGFPPVMLESLRKSSKKKWEEIASFTSKSARCPRLPAGRQGWGRKPTCNQITFRKTPCGRNTIPR